MTETVMASTSTQVVPVAAMSFEKSANLTTLNQGKALQIANRANLRDPKFASEYATDVQLKMSGFANDILGQVKGSDAGDIGPKLTNIIKLAQGVDPSKLNAKQGMLSRWFTKAEDFAKTQLVEFKSNFDSVSTQIEQVVQSLDGSRDKLLTRVVELDQMFEINKQQFVDLCIYLEAGKLILEKADVDIKALEEQFNQSNDAGVAAEIADYKQSVARFRKRLSDLNIIKTNVLQTAPQIRILQDNSITLADKIQNTTQFTVPMWKKQYVLALALQEQKSAIALENAVNDANNELLRRNSEMLKDNSLAIAEANQRSIIDIETLDTVQKNLLDTLKGVAEIEAKGDAHRADVEKRLVVMDDEIKKTMVGR